jgi:hypothetical protein
MADRARQLEDRLDALKARNGWVAELPMADVIKPASLEHVVDRATRGVKDERNLSEGSDGRFRVRTRPDVFKKMRSRTTTAPAMQMVQFILAVRKNTKYKANPIYVPAIAEGTSASGEKYYYAYATHAFLNAALFLEDAQVSRTSGTNPSFHVDLRMTLKLWNNMDVGALGASFKKDTVAVFGATSHFKGDYTRRMMQMGWERFESWVTDVFLPDLGLYPHDLIARVEQQQKTDRTPTPGRFYYGTHYEKSAFGPDGPFQALTAKTYNFAMIDKVPSGFSIRKQAAPGSPWIDISSWAPRGAAAAGAAGCFHCDKPADFRCSHCKTARYCGAECQTADWAEHQSECVAHQT